LKENLCHGACEKKETPEEYNSRVYKCMKHLENELPTFALVDDGLIENEQSCILIERGKFYGMGYMPSGINVHEIDDIKFRLTPYVENNYIRAMIYQYAERYPYKKINLRNEIFQQRHEIVS
jgi:DNA polymerase-3 subunit epsilon